ncbi:MULTISPECIES: HAD family hydrolase [Nitrosomonas]|uniref:Haloacid dehalogenase superfamily, subfamily IA, variant 3 with third motif having DD or ED/haloacid dehalogenase superfamily, subfamily IA, variant 1 with third motif having Dx(3-4)D or Dx(3-4)E n=1 Tax=Nitrosomonas oligotropha TaxID=42354 RepID=A0A1H8JQC7_9PROT|nr:HAD family phosphatase [Nitrosomonas oligotropha]SDW01693.1 haloacid dehalogenase superfamily, subfamily IA, variant 3 with third motif having DD or ED/haloacid dehalogenase superfamily, subfamily IA, variant 1 with third motif having Dx(3-4)D or Dx(3-4)E [Nitrosomonas oligotropha]SEN82567.1 haloacid dehalogenase superfamily, subfamily IA, variant 3 with third motif having DD or ED/haloacid dehalogenase superfamily, subfamily IA, variant 1 with third motif having Dx(3-4)D or Dx(3-4)E [Nitrosom
MIDTIIFDAEGIVIDTETIWDKGQAIFLQRRGFVYDRERIKPLLTGRTLAEGVEVMRQAYRFDGDTEALARERADIVRELFIHETAFIEGFLPFYESVRSRYKTCVATAMDQDLLKLVDQHLNLSALFENRIYTLDKVGYRSKPNPDIFLYAAQQLGSAPEHCVVIEDAPHGIDAAKSAGMCCIAISTTYDPGKLQKADFVVNAYAEIDLAAVDQYASIPMK